MDTNDTNKSDDVIAEFDQTNGKVDGLDGNGFEGDDQPHSENAFGTANGNNRGGGLVNEAWASVDEAIGHPDPENDGDTAEDRDPAVTDSSEDEAR